MSDNRRTMCQEFHTLSIKERLRNAVKIDINSPEFTWENLVSLYHSEHATSNKTLEDDMKSLEARFCNP